MSLVKIPILTPVPATPGWPARPYSRTPPGSQAPVPPAPGQPMPPNNSTPSGYVQGTQLVWVPIYLPNTLTPDTVIIGYIQVYI